MSSRRQRAVPGRRSHGLAAALASLWLGVLQPASALQDEAAEAARRAAEAEAALADIQQDRARLQALVDAAVVGYETALTHLGRVEAEATAADGDLEAADGDLAAAELAIDLLAREAYKRAPSGLFSWVLDQDDIGSAMHRALTVRLLLRDGVARVEQAEGARDRVAERRHQVQRLRAGVESAAADLVTRQAELDDLLRRAAELEVGARAVATAATAEAVRLAVRRSPGVVVDGRTCPVQQPVSFVDTWQAPRPGGRRHNGVDIFAPEGADLYAVAAGVIERTDFLRLGGITLHLRDDRGDVFYYAHLDGYAAGIVPGRRVQAGEVVGFVGRTGNARGTPPHLHWEHRPGGGPPVNPAPLADALC